MGTRGWWIGTFCQQCRMGRCGGWGRRSPASVFPSPSASNPRCVEQALKIMAQENLNQLPVVSAPGLIVGVATLAGIRGKIGKGEISCSNQIETAVSTNFKKVSLETNLRTLSRAMGTDHIAVVVHHLKLYSLEHGLEQMETLVGMVTDLDLVQFIAQTPISGQNYRMSSSSSGSCPQRERSSSAESPENPGSDCSEELSSDGSASH